MAAEWFCQIGQKSYGPLTAQDLARLARDGKLRGTDLVRKTAAGKWVKAQAVRGLTFPSAAAGAAAPADSSAKACPACGAPLAAHAVLCVGCGHDLRTGRKHSPAPVPAASRSRSFVLGGVALGILAGIGVAGYFLFGRGGETAPPGGSAVAQAAVPAESLPPAPARTEAALPSGGVTATPTMAVPANPAAGAVAAAPPAQAATPVFSFEEAFRAGKLAWQPVRNVELTTVTAGGRKTESFDFVTKLKYDNLGRSSADTTGQKTYTWPDRQATFAQDAVIRIDKAHAVREGPLGAGDEWLWTGQQWVAKPK